MEDGLFATLVEAHSCLYDKQSPDFKNIHKKQNAWTEIATAMTTNGKCWTKKYDIALFRNGVVGKLMPILIVDSCGISKSVE
jgi:hypothetical protein